MEVLQVGSNDTIKIMCEDLVYEKLSLGDCHITYKNVEHPYIQKFFMNHGVHANVYKEKYIEINGFISLKGSDLHNFLTMLHGVNLRENPAALDTVVEEEAKPYFPAKCR